MSVFLSDGWTLPNTAEPDELDVVLLPPPIPVSSSAPAVAVPPPPRPLPRSPIKRSKPVATPVAEPMTESAANAPDPHVAPTASAPQAIDAPAAQDAVPSVDAPAPVSLNALSRLPAKGQWRYTVTRGEGGLLIGQSTYNFEHDGQRYSATSRIETVGIAAMFVPAQITQESSGTIVDSGLQPQTFRNVQKKRTDVAQVDRTRGVVLNGEKETALGDSIERVQDMLSLYFQLGLILAIPALPPGEIHLPIVTGRKLDTYRFEFVGEEKITRQFNDYATRHARARNRDDVIDLWFAPELPLPVRLRIADRKGDVYEQWLDIPEKGFP